MHCAMMNRFDTKEIDEKLIEVLSTWNPLASTDRLKLLRYAIICRPPYTAIFSIELICRCACSLGTDGKYFTAWTIIELMQKRIYIDRIFDKATQKETQKLLITWIGILTREIRFVEGGVDEKEMMLRNYENRKIWIEINTPQIITYVKSYLATDTSWLILGMISSLLVIINDDTNRVTLLSSRAKSLLYIITDEKFPMNFDFAANLSTQFFVQRAFVI